MYEDSNYIWFLLIYLVLSFFLFLICARIVGWALGISKIPKNQETIIEQNDLLIDLLDTNLRLQRAIAKKQFGRIESDEDGDEG